MKKACILLTLIVWASAAMAEESALFLPQPHYTQQPGDPDWLAQAVQFHGHLGPWAIAGVRAGMAGRKAVGAQGYFDLQVDVEGPFDKPPRSCFLDGLQVGTGATMGKRNLLWKEGEEVIVRIQNTQTGARAEVRPTKKLLEIVGALKPAAGAERGGDREHSEAPVEALARRLAKLPAEEILLIREINQVQPTWSEQ